MLALRRYWASDHSLSVLLLALAFVIFVVPALEGIGLAGRLLLALFFSLILISGVMAVARSAPTTALVGGLVVTGLILRWLRLWIGGQSLVFSDVLVSSVFCATLAVVVMTQVLREGPITWYRIQGAVAFYLLLGLAWAFAYELVELEWPTAFNPPASAAANPDADPTVRFVYFSFITLTTVGYGDVTAVHPLARSLVTMEALTGQLFPAILLARLVSMELYHRRDMSL